MCVDAHVQNHMHAECISILFYWHMLYLISAPSPQWCMVDLTRMNGLLETVECPNCRDDKALYVDVLQMWCRNMWYVLITNPRDQYQAKSVHDQWHSRAVLQPSGVRSHCSEGVLWYSRNTSDATEDFPKEREEDQSEGNRGHQRSASKKCCHRSRNALQPNPYFPADQPVPITVSFDGTWQKQGHTSLYGVAAVIEIVTGLVVDYVVLSTYCHSCSLKHNEFKGQPDAFDAWYKWHKEDCSINYVGSSNAMEVEAAKWLWSRSLSLGLAYTRVVGDGDSKAYRAVVELEPYGSNVEIVKEDSVNHVHKRIGTALLKPT